MKIEVWSDFVCPFCYIGKRRLEEALAEFPEADQVEVSFKSFELDPNAPVDTEQSTYERLAEKYGKSIEEIKQMTEGVRQQAADVGLNFQFDRMIPTNTFDAHRLFQRAYEQGLGDQVSEQLFHAHFEAGKHLGDKETLTDLALKAGLSQGDVEAALIEDTYAESVRNDEDESKQIGVQGVPFFVINRKFAISGAQPKETFLKGLQKAIDEEKQTPSLESVGDDNGVCTDDNCDI